MASGWCGPWWPARRFVVVEAVPATGTWDWAAWIGDSSGRTLSGTARTRDDAMREAEWAARQFEHEPRALCEGQGVPM